MTGTVESPLSLPPFLLERGAEVDIHPLPAAHTLQPLGAGRELEVATNESEDVVAQSSALFRGAIARSTMELFGDVFHLDGGHCPDHSMPVA